MVPLYSMLLVVAGCTGAGDEGPGVDVREEAVGVVTLQALDPDDGIVTKPDGLYSLNDDQLLDPTVSPVVSAARFGERLVATENELLVGDVGLLPSPLEAQLPGPVESLVAAGSSLWIQTDSQWWMYSAGQLSAPELDGSPIGGLLVRSDIEGVPVVWVTVEDGLVALADSMDGPVVVARSDLEAERLAASTGGLWASTAKALHRFDGQRWTRVGSAPEAMAGHPNGPGIWTRTGDTVEHLRFDGRVRRQLVEDLPGEWAGCDEAGRLWTLDSAGTVRRAAGLHTAVLSGLLPDTELAIPQEVRVDLSHIDRLESATLLVDGNPVLLSVNEAGHHVGILDPVLLEPGDHLAHVEATWTDGTVSTQPVAFSSVVTGPITWIDHVQPLYRARCSVCHDNGTETILIGQQEWIDTIDQILVEVEAGRMPIGTESLDAPTIGVIRSWQQGGFP